MSRGNTGDIELARLDRFKRNNTPPAAVFGPELISFYKQAVEKRQEKFGKLAAVWSQLIPSTLIDHCSLESFSRGTLTVLVDTASHLYEIKQLLLAGLEEQLRLAGKSAGLKKINLKRGHWCDGEQRVQFVAGPKRGSPVVSPSSPQDHVRNRRRRRVE